MCDQRRTKLSAAIIIMVVASFLAIPLLSRLGTAPICLADQALAQDNPCLAQEATISALELQLLRLQLTGTAMQRTMNVMEDILRAQPEERLVTFVVVYSPTANPNATIPVRIVTATFLSASSSATMTAQVATLDIRQTPPPTLTLAPTDIDAQVEIIEVIGTGDLESEAIRIRNLGNTIDITGWTLSDSQGNVFTFPQQLLFSNSELTVYTREGQKTPVALFWGRDKAVWAEPGDIVTLQDANGRVQATIRLP